MAWMALLAISYYLLLYLSPGPAINHGGPFAYLTVFQAYQASQARRSLF